MAGAGGAVSLVELLEERRHLLDVACRLLGGGPGAERVIDEAYRRWFGLPEAERARIEEPWSWLVRVVGGVCLSRAAGPGQDRSAGPGPDRAGVVADGGGEVPLEAPEALSPAQGSAFVANDVFGTTPEAAARTVRRSEPQCVEPAERARRSLRDRRARPTSAGEHDAVVGAVREACAGEDERVLTSLLAADATAVFDSGGKVRAPAGPVHGDVPVARSLVTLLARHPRTTLVTHAVNGRTGLVVRYGRQVGAVVSLDVAGAQVVQVWVTLNPDKLRSWNHPVRSL